MRITVCILVLLFSMVNGQTRDLPAAAIETLEFDLQLGSLRNATATIRTSYTDSPSHSLHITAAVWTRGVADMLFPIHNQYETWIDTTSFLPVRSEKRIAQKNINQHFCIDYDHHAGSAISDHGHQWPIVPGCQTLFSLLPYLRRQPLQNGDSLAVILDIESHVWLLSGRMTNEKHKQGNAWHLRFVFEPAMTIVHREWKTDLLTNRISRSDTQLDIWLDAGTERLPLRLLFRNNQFCVDMQLRNRRE